MVDNKFIIAHTYFLSRNTLTQGLSSYIYKMEDDDCVLLETVSNRKRLLDMTIDIPDEDRRNGCVDGTPGFDSSKVLKTIKNPFYPIGTTSRKPKSKKRKKGKISNHTILKNKSKIYKLNNVRKQHSVIEQNVKAHELNNENGAFTIIRNKKKKKHRPNKVTKDTSDGNSSEIAKSQKSKQGHKFNEDVLIVQPSSRICTCCISCMKDKKVNTKMVSIGTNVNEGDLSALECNDRSISDMEISSSSKADWVSRGTSPNRSIVHNLLQLQSTTNDFNMEQHLSKRVNKDGIQCHQYQSSRPVTFPAPEEVLDVSNGLVLNELCNSNQKKIARKFCSNVSKDYADLKGKGKKDVNMTIEL